MLARSDDVPLKVCAVLMGGSTAETVATIQAALERAGPVRMTVVDLLMFHLRSPGQLSYSRDAEILRLGPADCGIATRFGSSSLNMIVSGGRAAFRRIVARGRAIFERVRPDVVILCHDRLYSELAFVRAAQEMSIPTILIQEGPFCVIGHGAANAPGLKVKYLLAPLAHHLGLLPPMPDYGHAGHVRICAASEAYADRWVASGIDRSRLRVTGVPRYDPLAQVRAEVAARSAARSAAVPKVCFLMQPFARHGKVDAAAAERLMREAAAGFNRAAESARFELVVRVHPRGTDADSAPLTDALTIPYTIQRATAPFTAVLPEFDLVVGFYSSAILEALACGVPAVCLRLPAAAFAEPSEGAKQDAIAGMGIPVAVDAAEFAAGLTATLGRRSLLVSEARLHDEIGAISGDASRRVAEVIAATAAEGSQAAAVRT